MSSAWVHPDAVISSDGLYRYELRRKWGKEPALTWVMLNPSTADAEKDDATITRCIAFSKRQNYGGLVVVNLFALRVTRPVHLFDGTVGEPNGPENVRYVREAMKDAYEVCVAWGANPKAFRSQALKEVIRRRTLCLGRTRAGAPYHPLYLPADTPFVPWP